MECVNDRGQQETRKRYSAERALCRAHSVELAELSPQGEHANAEGEQDDARATAVEGMASIGRPEAGASQQGASVMKDKFQEKMDDLAARISREVDGKNMLDVATALSGMIAFAISE